MKLNLTNQIVEKIRRQTLIELITRDSNIGNFDTDIFKALIKATQQKENQTLKPVTINKYFKML